VVSELSYGMGLSQGELTFGDDDGLRLEFVPYSADANPLVPRRPSNAEGWALTSSA
jgi:hypothetical protein